MQTLALLMDAARTGDEDARMALLERYLDRIRSLVRMRSTDLALVREDHDDLVQTAYRHVLVGLGRFRGRTEAEFLAWLSRMISGIVTDRERRNLADCRTVRREVRADPQSDNNNGVFQHHATQLTGSREAAGREELERVDSALADMPELDRETIVRSRYRGQTAREIGDAMGRSEVAVRQTLHRALAKLSRRLTE